MDNIDEKHTEIYFEDDDDSDTEQILFEDEDTEGDFENEDEEMMHDHQTVRVGPQCFYYIQNNVTKVSCIAALVVVTLIVGVATRIMKTPPIHEQEHGNVFTLDSFSLSSWEDACSSPSLISEEGNDKCRAMCAAFDCCDIGVVPYDVSSSSSDDTDRNDCSSSHQTECDRRKVLCKGIALDDGFFDKKDEQDLHWENGIQEEMQEKVEEAEMHDKQEEEEAETLVEISILEACSGDDPDQCREVCADHMCCVVPQNKNKEQDDVGENDDESCVDDPAMECDMYSPCATLSTIAESIDINLVCSEDEIFDRGFETCQELCSERLCCFIDGDENCQNSMEEWCKEYEICGGVFAEVMAIGVLPVDGSNGEGNGDP